MSGADEGHTLPPKVYPWVEVVCPECRRVMACLATPQDRAKLDGLVFEVEAYTGHDHRGGAIACPWCLVERGVTQQVYRAGERPPVA